MLNLTFNTITKFVITLGLIATLSIYSHHVDATPSCQLAKQLHSEAKKKKDIEQKIKGFQQALSHCENFNSRYLLGLAYLIKADYPRALNVFEQALFNAGENKKQQALTFARIAQVQFQLKQYQSAKIYIDNALKLSKKNQKTILSIARPIQLTFSTQTVSAEQIKQVLSSKSYAAESVVPTRVGFEFDSAKLTPQGREQVEQMVEALRDLSPKQHILLIGHTDDRGKAEYNLKLSEKRAKHVYEYMIAKVANAKYRVCFKGQGEQQLIITLATDDQQHAINRRVEIQTIRSCLRRS